MTLDEFFRDQISRGQPPLVALHNAAKEYADSLRKRPDCSQYADENAAWGEQQDSEAVALLREARRLLIVATDSRGWSSQEVTWFENVRNFLDGKQ